MQINKFKRFTFQFGAMLFHIFIYNEKQVVLMYLDAKSTVMDVIKHDKSL